MTGSVNSAQTEKSSHDLPSATVKSSPDLFDSLRKRSKSLADIGQNLFRQLAKNSVSRLSEIPAANSVINMTTDNQTLSTNTPNRANQLFRQQLPGITRQILGKRFNTINKLANLVMPAGSFDKASDQILELLADFASTVSSSDQVIDEAGVKTLADLQADPARSGRLARALNEKNRYIGMAQGAISGATGVAGAAADMPLAMILALRTVYLTGRAYGFELNQPEDRAMIFEALSNADLSLITEKQAILIGLNSVGAMLSSGNIQGLKTMLGSSNDFEPLLKLLSDSNGQLKWRISAGLLNKVTPVIGGAVGALYTSRLLKEVSDSASQVFEQARKQDGKQGITQQTTQPATEQQSDSSTSQQPLTIEDKLVNAITPATAEEQEAQKQAQDALLHNEDIAKVEISSRTEHDAQQLDEASKDEQIHDQLGALASDLIDAHAAEPATNDSGSGEDSGSDMDSGSDEDSKQAAQSSQDAADQATAAQASETQDTETQDTETQDTETQNAETGETGMQDSGTQDTAGSEQDKAAEADKPARRARKADSAQSSTKGKR